MMITVLFPMGAQATRYYVALLDATAAGTGASWDDPMTLANAINKAVAGDELWLRGYADGGREYSYVVPEEGYELKAGVRLYGGFAGTEASIDGRAVIDGKAYRIGGDEFIVIDRELDESQFRAGIAAVCNSMEQDGISISAGISWRSRNCNVMEQFDEADKLMYEAKHQYYSCKDRDHRRGYRHHMKK